MDPSGSLPKKPTLSVKIASLFFVVGAIILSFGLAKSVLEIPAGESHTKVFLVYIFLISICFLVAYGLYRHKQWSLYTAYAILLYLVINFFINLSSSFIVDIAIAGIPLLVIVVFVTYLLARKHKHFIH